MREVDLQKLVLDVVKEHGGTGRKLSHRFLVGVADLLIQHPAYGAAVLEVKLDPIPVKSNVVKPAVTVPQWRFLREFRDAGMRAGVLSFVNRGPRWGAMITMDSVMCLEDYVFGKRVDLKSIIWKVTERFMKNG